MALDYQLRRALQHAFLIAAFIQIGDQHHDGLLRPRNHLLTITECQIDIGAATQLYAEQ
mgnify:CR=1 FL=1